ncbi:MAG: hypothetical protein INQ03_08125 [Candidatus Heimdallarchaeota archaeon]|nr:hypothetical protein [Candidatus Heimdallarchaeota archaeon]
MSRKVEKILKDMVASIPEIKAVMLITHDDPIFVGQYEGESRINERNLMVSTMLVSAESLVMGEGELEQVYVRHSGGYIIAQYVSMSAILVVYTTRDVKLGLIFLDSKRTAEKLAKIYDDKYLPLILRTEGHDIRESIDELLDLYDEWESKGIGKKI